MKNSLIRFFERPSSIDELAKEAGMLREVDFLRGELESCEDEILSSNWLRLQVARCIASGTLKKGGEHLICWKNAQSLIHKWVDEDYTPQSHEDLFLLYSELVGIKHTSYRMHDVYTASHKHPAPNELHFLMDWFIETVLKRKESEHPVLHASKIRQISVSIHPFQNANGRFSQLLADFYLLHSGYLPQSFEDPVFGLVVGLPEQRAYFNPHIAFMYFARTVQYSYELVLKNRINSLSA